MMSRNLLDSPVKILRNSWSRFVFEAAADAGMGANALSSSGLGNFSMYAMLIVCQDRGIEVLTIFVLSLWRSENLGAAAFCLKARPTKADVAPSVES